MAVDAAGAATDSRVQSERGVQPKREVKNTEYGLKMQYKAESQNEIELTFNKKNQNFMCI